MNPRFSLRVAQPCKIATVLVQKNAAASGGNLAALKAIGLYVTRADGTLLDTIYLSISLSFAPLELSLTNELSTFQRRESTSSLLPMT